MEAVYRLSPMQHLMLLHGLSDPTSRVLFNQFCYEIHGDLDVDDFRRAWCELVSRHASLRSAFLTAGLPHPVQAVRRTAKLAFEVVDLSGEAESDRPRRLDDLRRADRRRGFDPTKPPLVRVTLARLGEAEWMMIWSSHHLALDRWCVTPLLGDLAALYRAARRGVTASLGEAGEYRDYIAWIQRQDPAAAESYWRASLRSLREPSLVAQANQPQASDERGHSTCVHQLDPALDAALRELARRNGLTPSTMVQGAIGSWLAHTTGRAEVAFGLTVSGRPTELAGVESTIGSFINNVPVVLRLREGERVLDWLRTIQVAQARRSRYEYVSPVRIQQFSDIESASPLFDLLVLIHPGQPAIEEWEGFELRPASFSAETAYPLTLTAGDGADGRLELSLSHDCRRFASGQARAALDAIAGLLARIVERSDGTLGELVPLAERPSVTQEAAGSRAVPASAATEPLAAEDPEGATEATLTRIWRQTLGTPVGLDEDLLAFGATSLQVAQAMYRIEAELGVSLPLSTMFEAGSIRELLEQLDQPRARSSGIIEIQPRGDRPQLFVIPGIGGNVVGLAGLARALGPEQPFYGLQSKGLDGRDAPALSVEQIAEEFLEEMRGVAREPFVLLGICLGGSVAHEMAVRLSAQHRPPALLGLMDPVWVGERGHWFARSGAGVRFVARRLRLYWEELRRRRGSEVLELFREKLSRAGEIVKSRGLAPDTRMELNQYRVSQANLHAALRYRPDVYRGPRSCLFFTEDRSVDGGREERKAWIELLETPPAIRSTPGFDTGNALTAEHVGAFAESLREEIDASV